MSILPPSQYPANIGLPPNQAQGVRCTSVLTFKSTFLANNNPVGSVTAYDLIMEDSEGLINNIQSVYIDASLSSSPFIVTIRNTGQSIFVRQKSQGYYPLLCGPELRIEICAFTPGGSGYFVNLQFFNSPIAPCVWDAYDKYHGFAISESNTTGAAQNQSTQFSVTGATYPSTLWPATWGNVWVNGFDVTVIGAASDVNTMKQITLVAAVKGWGGTNNLIYGLAIDANGNGYLSKTFDPPIVTNGAQTNMQIQLPALTSATPTIYTANLYWQSV